MLKLSDFVVQFIANQGVKHVFLVTGGGAMHLNESLSRCTAVESVCNSHEQASAIAAENYAKATNHLGVCLVTTGPGGTNTVTGVAGAWLDSTPVLFISGQVKRPDRMFHADGTPRGLRQFGVQEVDIVSIVRPITKYAVTVTDPETIRYHLERALCEATTGRPGPVWIDIPLDVQAIPINPANLPGYGSPAIDWDISAPATRVAAAIQIAKRPLIFAGNGIRLAHAEQEFTDWIQRVKIPVVSTWCAADLISSDDPLFVGRPGSVAARGANFALQNCDLLIAIGVRLDFAITGYAPDKLARGAQKIVIDSDQAELEKLHPNIDEPVQSDAGVFLREMLRQDINPGDHHCWDQRCREWKTCYAVVTDEDRKPSGRVSIYHFAEIIHAETSENDLLVSGSSGSAIEIFLLASPTRTGQRIFHTAGLGSMGFGLPASIGVCLAGDRRRTICVDGDGGFQFNIQELETVRRLNLPIKFFILNNDGYASIRASQTNFFGGARLGCDQNTGLTLPDISRVAAAYGVKTAIIEDQTDLRADVNRVLNMHGPVVCDVRVIPDEIRAPRLASYQKSDGSLVSRPLEDLWPFLPRQEFLANMIVPPLPGYDEV
jgi:acetolactate synthase-1/2/3 large subunit